MIRWILENERHDAKFLGHPTLEAAKAAGETAYSNATHLVVLSGPNAGRFLRAEALNLGDADTPVDMTPAGTPAAAAAAPESLTRSCPSPAPMT